MNKSEVNKPVYLGLLVSDISKIVKYWYDYTKSKFGGNATLYYTDTDSLIAHLKSEDVYTDLHANILSGTKRCKTKHYTLFYHKDF